MQFVLLVEHLDQGVLILFLELLTLDQGAEICELLFDVHILFALLDGAFLLTYFAGIDNGPERVDSNGVDDKDTEQGLGN